MAVVVTPGDWLRFASGVLVLGFGGALAVSRWRLPKARWLGLAHVGIGILGIGTNFATDEPMLLLAHNAAGAVGMSLALVATFLFARATSGWRAASRMAMVAACFAAVVYIATSFGSGFPSGLLGSLQLAYLIGFFGYPALAVLVTIHWTRQSPGSARAGPLAWLALGLALWPITLFAHTSTHLGIAEGPSPWAELTLTFAALLAAAWVIAWTSASTQGRRRATLAIVIVLVLLGATVIGEARGVDVGAYGIARIIGLGIVAYAVLRLDALGAGFQVAATRHGFAATSFLVVLLVTAQIAQNFLAAQYGLLMGGVVAGALLVAAKPIERALEGRSPARPAQPDAAKEDAFRAAVRMALRDRVITREEELHLHRVAQHMGIPTGRTHELLIEVERESRVS